MSFVLIAVGLVLLVAGAELLVRGASSLARTVGISPLVVGLTVVAYGTSSPELAVTLQSSFGGESDVAVGNIVGSNISNILLILGFAAAIAPLRVSLRLLRQDVPIMLGVSFALLIIALDGAISRGEGVALAAGAFAYTAWLLVQSIRENRRLRGPEKPPPPGMRWQVSAPLVVVGLALLIGGAQLLVAGATEIAESIGVSELIIGLTIVAIGTSLPELASSAAATLRGDRDIAVGNVVGSNIFNVLLVLGLTAALAGDITVPDPALRVDIPVMLAVSLAALPIAFTGFAIARWEGLLFLAYFVAYMLYLYFDSTSHDAAPWFNRAMVAFVIPLTGVTLLVLAVNFARNRMKRRHAMPPAEA